MNRELTRSQRRTFETIVALIEENGYAPTVREICAADGLSSPSTTNKHLETLRKKGYITHDPKKHRSIAILKSLED